MGELVGAVVAYAGNIDGNIHEELLEKGWLLCDGSEVSRVTFADLFERLGRGRIYGRGDGANTFNLPDYRGYFLRGVDNPDDVGGRPAAGRDKGLNERKIPSTNEPYSLAGSTQNATTALPVIPFLTSQNGNHRHSTTGSDITDGPSFDHTGLRIGLNPHKGENTSENGEHSHTISSGGDAETRPINMSVNWLIKAIF